MTVAENLEALKPAFMKTLKELISIQSVEGPAAPGAPFGTGIREALTYLLDLARRDGFSVRDTDGYGGHIEFSGRTGEIVGIAGHLDVVSEGSASDWVTPAFAPVIRDGCIFGRGVIDDKGPLLSCYYAMKALKDSGFCPTKTVRLIIGCDEETNWKGMEYYLQKERTPNCGFSPDGDYPVIHAEMGLIVCSLNRSFSPTAPMNHDSREITLLSFTGGTAPNVTAEYASIILDCGQHTRLILEYLDAYHSFHPHRQFTFTAGDGRISIKIKGKAAHGASPEKGQNAISIGFDLLFGIPYFSYETQDFLRFYTACIGFDLHGERIGCNFSDDVSGSLILNVGEIDWKDSSCRLTLNIRYPVTMSENQIYQSLTQSTGTVGISVEPIDHQPPLYAAPDDPLVSVLLDVYRKHTGDFKTPPLVTAGATYARAIPNTLAFGPLLPGEPDLSHQSNECISIDHLMLSARIYADAIQRLSQ